MTTIVPTEIHETDIPPHTTSVRFLGLNQVRFTAVVSDFREAAILFRQATGNITALSHSMVGSNPSAWLFRDFGIGIKYHRRLRGFKTPEELGEFWTYVCETIGKSAGPHPTLENLPGGGC